MVTRIRIAIDSMGGDFGLRVSLPAAIQSLKQFPDIEITLVGDEQQIRSHPDVLRLPDNRLTIVNASEQVAMADKPSFALRNKTDSSMRVAIDLLQQGKVDAVVSAGNTGALMAMGCYVLKTLPGIARPAICSPVPSAQGRTYLLDLGANVDCTAEHLYQFAIMGSAMVSAVERISNPSVALLNIGEEQIKGNEQVKEAATLLDADPQINYVGYVEGGDIFRARANVIVCDGFVGNIALKTSEGTAEYISNTIRHEFKRSLLASVSSLLFRPVLKSIYRKLDPQQYNGASFLGLQGVIVKSHGNSTIESFCSAIARARSEVEQSMLAAIKQHLSQLPDSQQH